jgi:DNA-binding transcriptional ArsR family regulator
MSVDKIFEALSSAPRRRILAFLAKTDMTAGEIAQRFASMMSQPAISKHLSVLENAGLVWREKRGQNVHYGLKEDALTGTLVHFLAEVCPRSRPFRKDSAEAARRKKGRRVEAKPGACEALPRRILQRRVSYLRDFVHWRFSDACC